MMPAPGATTLGLYSSKWSASPSSSRGPSFEKSVTRSSERSSVRLWVDAPTAIDLSAEAGVEMHSVALSFPVAMHTTNPESTATLMYAEEAPFSVPLPPWHTVGLPSDMLTTSMPCQMLPGDKPDHSVRRFAIAHSMPRLLPPTLAPASDSTLQSTSRAPGATPAKNPPGPPVPSAVPATWVA
jgi:hypothetical protein